jgi:hypothetical protein
MMSAPQARAEIMIKSLSKKTLMIWVHSGDTIIDIKLTLQYMKWIPVEQQRLLFEGKQSEIRLCCQNTTYARIQHSFWFYACMEEQWVKARLHPPNLF